MDNTLTSPGQGEKGIGKQHVEMVARFCEYYNRQTGMPYRATQKDYVLMARMVKEHGVELVAYKAKLYASMCSIGETWFCRDGWADFTIGKLCAMWNSILPRRSNQQKQDDKLTEGLEQQEAMRERISSIINSGR